MFCWISCVDFCFFRGWGSWIKLFLVVSVWCFFLLELLFWVFWILLMILCSEKGEGVVGFGLLRRRWRGWVNVVSWFGLLREEGFLVNELIFGSCVLLLLMVEIGGIWFGLFWLFCWLIFDLSGGNESDCDCLIELFRGRFWIGGRLGVCELLRRCINFGLIVVIVK